MGFSSIPELIEALKKGEFVILLDDEGRENEGDLIMAAEKVTAEKVNFMIQKCSGIICLAMRQEKANVLELPLMVENNASHYQTNFAVSIEAAHGVTTGVSAKDRTTTILAASGPNAKASDLVRPGHVFPLIAKEGGVLVRAGHTEATCDLLELAGLEPCGILCEMMNQDGSMSRQPELMDFSKRYGIKIGTVESLVAYRQNKQNLIQ